MNIFEPLLRHKDLSIGCLGSLALGVWSYLSGLEVLSIGAFLASGLYIAKLCLRLREPEKAAGR